MKTNRKHENKREAFENMAEAVFERHQQEVKNARKNETKTKKTTRILDETIANQTILLECLKKTLSRIKKANIS